MPNAYCAACKSRKTCTYFKVLPKDEKRRKKWIQILNMDDSTDQCRICEVHFESKKSKYPISVGKYWTTPKKSERKLRAEKRYERERVQKSESESEKIERLENDKKKLKEKLRTVIERKRMQRHQFKVRFIEKRVLFRVEMWKHDSSSLFHLFSLRSYLDFQFIAQKLVEIMKKKSCSNKLDMINCVGVVLLRCRRGFTYQTISILFSISISTVKKIIDELLPQIVKILSGSLRFLSEEELNQVYFPELEKYSIPKNTIIIDCTYIYLEHSSNFLLQHSTFSLHKFRNLAKFMVMCYPNGRITQVFGPYAAEDDNFIISHVMNSKEFLEQMKGIDCVVVDRGFRHCEKLNEMGIKVLQPVYLGGRTQFTEEEIKYSRMVTSLRSVIENCNSRIKYQRILNQLFSLKELPKVELWFRLASSLSNLCYWPLRGREKPFHLIDFNTDSENDSDYIYNESDEDESGEDGSDSDLIVEEELKLNGNDCELEFNDSNQMIIDPPFNIVQKVMTVPKVSWEIVECVELMPLLSLSHLKEIFQTPTLSTNKKSTLERGMMYLEGPEPKYKKLWKLKGKNIWKRGFESSFSKVLKTVCIQIENNIIYCYCDCKNGVSYCAHQACFFLLLLARQLEIDPTSFIPVNKELTERSYNSLIIKRKVKIEEENIMKEEKQKRKKINDQDEKEMEYNTNIEILKSYKKEALTSTVIPDFKLEMILKEPNISEFQEVKSKKIYQWKDISQIFYAAQSIDDGNCFFYATSILLSSTATNWVAIKIATALEILKERKKYQTFLINTYDPRTIEDYFVDAVSCFSVPSSIIFIAAATVLKRPIWIYSVHFDKEKCTSFSSCIKSHSHLHYRYNPLGSNLDLTPLTLLFSKSKSKKQPGHFIPLLKKQANVDAFCPILLFNDMNLK